MIKKIFTSILLAIVLVMFTSPIVFADSKKDSHYNVEGKFYTQAHKILEHNKELGLTDEQIKQIKDIKKQVKKDLVQQDAEIKNLTVEINTLMWEAPMDLTETNALVDQKYELTKKKAKYLLGAYDKLHKVLTKEQLNELNKTF